MKTKFLRFMPYLAFGVMLVSLNACDAISGVKLTDQTSVDKMLPSRIEKHIDPQSIVFEFFLGTTSDFSTEMDVASVTFLAPGATEPQKYAITIPGNQKPREQKIINVGINKQSFKPETGIKLCDIDFSKIASNIAKASEFMKAENMEVSGISSYDIIIDGNPDNTIHKFCVRSKAGSEFGTDHGRAAVITNYYETNFIADANGNVTSKE